MNRITAPHAPPGRRIDGESGAKPHLKPLTGLRFFAALLVVLYHARNPFSEAALFHLPQAAMEIINAGFVGVGLFFILSGFILAYNYGDETFATTGQLKQFWVSRLARIYPVYLLGLIIAAPKFFSGLMTEHRNLLEAGEDFVVAGSSVFSLMQAWFLGKALQWNGPGWSLSAEAFFYLTFPVLLIFFRRWTSRRAALVGIAVCWAVAMVPPAIYYSFPVEPLAWKDFIRFNPVVRLPEFALGIFLGKLFMAQLGGRATGSSSTRGSWSVVIVTALVLAALSFQDHLPRYLLHNGLLAPLFAALVLSLAWTGLETTRFSRLASAPLLVLLGEASYAIYILHTPLQKLVVALFGKFHPAAFHGPWMTSVTFLAYLGLTIGAAIVSFKLVEVPARRLIKRWFLGGRRVAPANATSRGQDPGLFPEPSLESVKQP